MTMELPPELQTLDETVSAAMRGFAPPDGLADRAVAGLKRRAPLPNPFRMRLSPMVVKSAAAAAAVAMLGTFGYLADQRINGSRREAVAQVDESFFGLGVKLRGNDSDHLDDQLPGLRESNRGAGDELGASVQKVEGVAGQNLTTDGAVNWDSTGWVGAQNDTVHTPRTRSGGEAQGQAESRSLNGSLASNDRYDLGGRPSLQSPGRERAENGISDPSVTSNFLALNKPSDAKDTITVPSKAPQEIDGLKLNRFAPANYGVVSDKLLSLDGNKTYTGQTNNYTGVTTINAGTVRGTSFAPGAAIAAAKQQLTDTGKFEAAFKDNGRATNAPVGVVSAPVGLAIAQDAAGPGTSAPPPAQVEPSRKVIRSGDIEFEVDSFDSSLMTVTKLAIEDGGFVASTDSAKLPNGKTRGMVSVRVPPDRLDAYVLKLRGLGDLKTQKITSQDVSKSYSDTESALRAARAMESRLLEMIAKGQGAIKDLLLAEKELGVWREKIEQHEGQKRYYDSLISLSTLNITLQEKDIKSAAGAIETERISAGVETDDVEKARTDVIKAIDEAGGRIITSDLKKLDAGQFAATISAEIAPDKTGPIVDRLKQLGKVARLDVDRKQTTTDGQSAPLPGAHVEKKPSVVTISLYNLANVAPRLTTTVTLASSDVEASYRTLLTAMEAAGGRAVSSQLQRPRADQVTASMQLESPSAQAAAMEAVIKSAGESMSLQLSENPDSANVTSAKQGFSVQIISAASVPARETSTLQIAAADVAAAHKTLSDLAIKSGARVLQSNLTEGDRNNLRATLSIELPRSALADWDKSQSAAGDVLSRSVVRSSDTQSTLDSKVRIDLTVYSAEHLPARESTTATVNLGAADKAQASFAALAQELGGRVIDQNINRDPNGRNSSRVVIDVPRDKAARVIGELRTAGEIWSLNTASNPQAPDGQLARARFDLTFAEGEALVGKDAGVWQSIRDGLSTSLRGLAWSLQLIIIGVCLVAPWVLILWAGWKFLRRRKTPVASS